MTVRELDDRAAMEAALAENVQRRNLSPIEEAEGYERLLEEFGCTQERLSAVVGRSRPHIANTLRLLALPDAVRHMVDEGSLSAGHARALLAAPDPEGLAYRTVAQGLSVRSVERIVREGETARRSRAARDEDALALEGELAESLGLPVSLRRRGEGGSLTLHYRSLDQLGRPAGPPAAIARRLLPPLPLARPRKRRANPGNRPSRREALPRPSRPAGGGKEGRPARCRNSSSPACATAYTHLIRVCIRCACQSGYSGLRTPFRHPGPRAGVHLGPFRPA